MSDLWNLVWGKPQVDPNDLAVAIEQEAVRTNLDFRTRILIKDSTEALEKYWGNQRLSRWLGSSKARQQIEAIRKEELGETGFPSLKDRIMEKTHPKTIEQFFRDLGSHLAKSVTIQVGGSVALIMTGALSRATEDIDVVDEVPAEIRHLRPLLDQLTQRYGIRLAHFQSHYLPTGWQNRLHSLGSFGNLQVYLVDVIDVFLSKLFSKRIKDLDDLRVLEPQVDKDALGQRLRNNTQSFFKEADLRKNAEKNWYIVFGENLPVQGTAH